MAQEIPEEDTWAQTVLTITPEDDAVLREVKPDILVSADVNTSLDLNTNSFLYRRPLTPKYLVDFNELEDENIRHVEVQTYLQGVSVVDIPIEYKDEISQTLYMSSPCPPMKYYEDIMTSMRDDLIPEMKNTRQTQTILTINPDLSVQITTEILKMDVIKEEKEKEKEREEEEKEEEEKEEEEEEEKEEEEEEKEEKEEKEEEEIKDVRFVWNEEDYLQTELDTLISDILYYLEERVFWILDPTSLLRPITTENFTQTLIKYNGIINNIVIDNETQTELTCQPKSSNTELLSDYQANKNLINEIFEECLDKAVESVLLSQYILEEIIEKCGEILRYPPKDQDVQTVATYTVDEKKEEVLRKLQLPIVVDSLESSIVVLALIDDMLESVCQAIYKNARCVSKAILQDVVVKSAYIGSKIEKIRNQSNDKLIEQILNQRREKIAKLMMKKETDTVFTQTSISGIHEITKLEDLKESFSCICLKGSKCYTCIKRDKDIRTLRTQDILLAYNSRPCQVVSSPFKIEDDEVCSYSTTKERSMISTTSSSDDSSLESATTIDVVLQPKEKINLTESLDGWTRAIDAALTIPWSPQSSLSETDENEKLTLQTMKVLQILKSTFCIRDTCPISVLEKLTKKSTEEDDNFLTNTIYNSCLCSKTNDDCITEENIENNSSIIDTKTYNSSFENEKCLCHICYTLEDSLRQFPENNKSCNVKIIPIQSAS